MGVPLHHTDACFPDIAKIPAHRTFRRAGIFLPRQILAVMVIDTDHDGCRLDDGVRILADLKTELFDGVQADGRRDDITALQLDADDAVDGTLLDGDNLALELIACAEFHVFPSLVL